MAGGWVEAGTWGSSRGWPLAVRFVADESTGSFLSRFARANGRGVGDLLQDVGEGGIGRSPVEPCLAEVYLSRPALERLAVLTGRRAQVLQRALPNLRDPLLLADEGPRWHYPWTPAAGSLVRACPGAPPPGEPTARGWWRGTRGGCVCGIGGGRDAVRAGGPAWFDLAALPEVTAARLGCLRLERRFGPTGAALVADAFAIAGWWWRRAPQAPCWRRRERCLGVGPGAVRTAVLVVTPEAFALARLLLRHERVRGAQGGQDVAAEAELLCAARAVAGRLPLAPRVAQQPVAEWLARHHRILSGTEDHGGVRVGRREPVRCLVHGRDEAQACLRERTCLPWQWSDLHTRP
ncbi:TniQ family protein [Embleya sp. MST-111070]|uniref:TniQ family protein n=1 Tax=Embleya sp. MST-111070 TaxID=3398231 RepID=UPI003F73845E